MSSGEEIQERHVPDSTFKWPRPFGNLTDSSVYPPWKPVDTKKETFQILRFTFYTTVGAYAWLYIWKRSTFKLGLPLTVGGFATVATASRGIASNIREKNDAWNTLVGVGMGNLAVLTVGFKNMPLKHKVMTGVSGAIATALIDQWTWAQSRSFAGRDTKHLKANTESELPKQQFWDVWRRRPLSQTVDEVGSGRGIFKS